MKELGRRDGVLIEGDRPAREVGAVHGIRGLLWKGFSASWGPWPAGILVTLLFTGLHFSEVKDYWPAALTA